MVLETLEIPHPQTPRILQTPETSQTRRTSRTSRNGKTVELPYIDVTEPLVALTTSQLIACHKSLSRNPLIDTIAYYRPYQVPPPTILDDDDVQTLENVFDLEEFKFDTQELVRIFFYKHTPLSIVSNIHSNGCLA
jgi:hypothetical protein